MGGTLTGRLRKGELQIAEKNSTAPTKELEQKFKILLSQPQEQKDFSEWQADAEQYSYTTRYCSLI
jgi:hypothetical protein